MFAQSLLLALFILISHIINGTSKVTKQAAAATLHGPDLATPVPIVANAKAMGITPSDVATANLACVRLVRPAA